MDKTLFMNMMRVAFDDYLAHDHEIEGIILVTVKKDRNDELAAQFGTSMAPETTAYILDLLLNRIATGQSVFTQIPQKNMIRKAV